VADGLLSREHGEADHRRQRAGGHDRADLVDAGRTAYERVEDGERTGAHPDGEADEREAE
jgi:hypothetical protein